MTKYCFENKSIDNVDQCHEYRQKYDTIVDLSLAIWCILGLAIKVCILYCCIREDFMLKAGGFSSFVAVILCIVCCIILNIKHSDDQCKKHYGSAPDC